MSKKEYTQTETDWMGNPVRDATGEPIKETIKSDGSKEYTQTQTDWLGNAVRDATGEPIKETTKSDDD